MSHWVRFKKCCFSTRCLVVALVLVTVTAFLTVATYTIKNVFPETEMVLNSKCSNPFANWDGKILNIPVYKNGYSDRPSYFNIHDELNYVDTGEQVTTYAKLSPSKPVIIWGTHHKTGTFVAKKIFAKICARMQWCCLFHVTRDSVHAVKHALDSECVDVLGHNQWIWDPASPTGLNLTNYRFFHFYRHPFKKIISGYRYHFDGAEAWTQKRKPFNAICAHPLTTATLPALPVVVSTGNATGTFGAANAPPPPPPHLVSRQAVHDYCALTYLCETCCRAEHQAAAAVSVLSHHHHPENRTYEHDTRLHINGGHVMPSSSGSGSGALRTVHHHHGLRARRKLGKEDTNSGSSSSGGNSKRSGGKIDIYSNSNSEVGGRQRYERRREVEYKFLCNHLGRLSGVSLQSALQASSAAEGILTEAALDFYESLRMARLVNATLLDPRALNIDLDEMNRDFSGAIWRILGHLAGLVPAARMAELHEELLFYDLRTSPLYRWSMSNPLVNHVDPQSSSNGAHSSAELMRLLVASPEAQALYAPVFELLAQALPRGAQGSRHTV